MCQAHVKSKIQFFWNFWMLKILKVYLQFFLKNNYLCYPSYSIPGEKLTYLHVKTTIVV